MGVRTAETQGAAVVGSVAMRQQQEPGWPLSCKKALELEVVPMCNYIRDKLIEFGFRGARIHQQSCCVFYSVSRDVIREL